MKKSDLLTIISLSSLSWVIFMVSHELIGHGGACLLIGGTPKYFDSMYFIGAYPEASFWREKFVKAGGSLINIIIGILSIIYLAKLKNKSNWLGYFLWLTIMFNLFSTGHYIAFGRFINEGMDWALFLKDLNPLWFWETLELILGIGLISTGFYFGRKYQFTFLNFEKSIVKQNVIILLVPLITVTIVSTGAAYYIPNEDKMMMIMGGIGNSLFFNFGMVILTFIPISKQEVRNKFIPTNNYLIIILSLIITLFYVFVISKGIDL